MRLHHLTISLLLSFSFSCHSQEEEPLPVAESEYFVFYNNVWINLHHFLFQTAKDIKKEGLSKIGDYHSFQKFSPTEKEKAAAVIVYYQSELIENDLLFNNDLYQIKTKLSAIPNDVNIQQQGFDIALAEKWQVFLPVYLKHFWPNHKAQNELVLQQNIKRIKAFEEAAFERLSLLSQASWPLEKIRVDITYNADWAGAYTTTNPIHVVTSTKEPGLAGDWVETLFHESCHGLIGGRRGAVSAMIAKKEEELNLKAPRQLWHGILFYFAGRVIQDLLKEEGISYELYMLREKVFDDYYQGLQTHMEPYLQGKINLDMAIEQLIISLQK